MKKLTITSANFRKIWLVEANDKFVTMLNLNKSVDFKAKYIFLWVILISELGVSRTHFYENRN